MNQASTKKMTPGDDMHLTLLMAPHNLNLVTGQDRQHLLAFGRAAFEAGQKCQGCSVPQNGLHQIAEPSHSMSQYASKDDMLKAVMAENEQLRAQLAAAQPVFSHMELRADGSMGAGRAVAVDTMGREMPSYNPIAAAQQGVQPFGYVNTQTGQFFKDVEPCRQNNEGHWRTVYTHPTTQGMSAQVRVGTLWIEESGANDIELPPFSLPKLSPGEYALFTLAAQAKQGGLHP